MSEDYYDLLGVDPSAPTDEIRDKYRDRKRELDERDDDASRTESAQLNRAWNVLSDPYQRGRYDASRDAANLATDDVEVLDESPVDAAPAKRRGLFSPPPPRQQRERAERTPAGKKQVPTLTLPSGMRLAETRPRLTAMAIDLFVVFMLFIGAQFISGPIERHVRPQDVKVAHQRSDALDAAKTRASTASDKASTADKHYADVKKNGPSSQLEAAKAAATTADAAKKSADDAVTKATDAYNSAEKKFTWLRLGVALVLFVVGGLYLIIPSALNGQTLGKRLQRVRVVRQDGSPLGWAGALRRYGLIVGLTFVLYPYCFGPYAALIAVVVLIGWMRNANRQGMHDRVAKTIVVDAD